MQERVLALGGTFEIGRRSAGGTKLTAIIPLVSPHDANSAARESVP
jgi:signal transduction histidine kinase